MTSSTQSKTTQSAVIAIILLACFIAMFYMYYEPTTRFICPAAKVQTNNVSEEMCHRFLNTNCTVSLDTRPTTTAPKVLPTAKKEPEIIMLIWMWPFGSAFDLRPCTIFNVQGCLLTTDRNLYDQAHGVMIHHRDISWDLSNLPKQPRPFFQKWVWYNMESPTHSGNNPQLNELFNLTSSYRRDSDIPVGYGSLVEATDEQKSFQIPQKDKLVCWIVSNYNPNYKRSHYFTEFSKYITVDAYGGHFNRRISGEEYSKTVSSCKFYLSFENSIHRDYISEKVYQPLNLLTVPVVIGPPRENYEQFLPSNAFIHVDDFPSPKELAEHLKHIDQNDDLYRQYFTWREHFVAVVGSFGLEHTCQACAYIRKYKTYKVKKDLNSWYFG